MDGGCTDAVEVWVWIGSWERAVAPTESARGLIDGESVAWWEDIDGR